MNFSFGSKKKNDAESTVKADDNQVEAKPESGKRKMLLYSVAGLVFVIGGGFLAYQLMGTGGEPVVVVDHTKPVEQPVDNEMTEKKIYKELVAAGLKAETETLKNHPFDPENLSWDTWKDEVRKSDELKSKLRESFASAIYKEHGITKDEAAKIMEKGMKNKSWNLTEQQQKKNGTAYFYTGAKQFMIGGDEYLLRAYSNFSLAAKLGMSDAAVMVARIAPAFSEDQIAAVNEEVAKTVAKLNAGEKVSEVAVEVEEDDEKEETKSKANTATKYVSKWKPAVSNTAPVTATVAEIPDSIGGPATPLYREPSWIDVDDQSEERAYAIGYREGFSDGYEEGSVDGYDLGYDDGYEGRPQKTTSEIRDELNTPEPNVNLGRYRAILQDASQYDRRSIWEGRSDSAQ